MLSVVPVEWDSVGSDFQFNSGKRVGHIPVPRLPKDPISEIFLIGIVWRKDVVASRVVKTIGGRRATRSIPPSAVVQK